MLMYPNLMPGQGTERDSVEKRLTWGPVNSLVLVPIILDEDTVDARSTVTTELLPGLILGKLTAEKNYKNYSSSATDGTQIADAILATPVNMLDAAGSTGDRLAYAIIAGPIKNAECGGLDALARSHLFGRIWFDDDHLGQNDIWRQVVIKATDYTVLAADSGTHFTTRGGTGTNFTLPTTLANGFRARFTNEVDQNLTVTAPANTLVAFNNLTATSVAFSTGGSKIGGTFEIRVNDNATKYLVIPSGSNTVTVA